MTCVGCGRVRESNARCLAGHFFCDVCHSGETVDLIQQVCLDSKQTDPVALTLHVMRHPRVKMHGAEHHYLTPAALLTSYSNLRGEPFEKKQSMTSEILAVYARLGGPRCCKRNTWLATLSAARQRLGTPMQARGARCEFSERNPDCHKDECPFQPRTGPHADVRAEALVS